ncbi:hypothetical protein VTI74DRAFT_4742 [Chaetomium olivicolor]
MEIGLNKGKRILITGAGTPAGLWAVQLAKLAGASEVVGTCDAQDIQAVRFMGADEVYDWTGDGTLADWTGEPFDIVFDLMGGITLTRAWRLVKLDGKVLSASEDIANEIQKPVNPGIQCFHLVLEHTPKYLNIISSLLDRGLAKWSVDPNDMFDFHNYEQALVRLSTSTRGQVVLLLDDESPQNLIWWLEMHQDNWGKLPPFNQFTMEKARLEDPPSPFEFCKWLRTEGSNHPDLVQPVPQELKPLPPLPELRSRSTSPGNKTRTKSSQRLFCRNAGPEWDFPL